MTFYQIAKNTLRESLREPIFYLLLLSALIIIGFSPMVALFVFREQIKLVADTGLSTTLVFGLLCSVLCAGHTVTREMKNGTVLLLLSKPVSRTSFIFAKIAGIMAAMAVFVLSCEAAILIAIRVASDQFELNYKLFSLYFVLIGLGSLYGAIRNYLNARAFSSSASFAILALIVSATVILYSMPRVPEMADENEIMLSMIVPIFLLLMFAIWIMVALTVALSTRLEMVANLTVVSIIFLCGLISDYFFGSAANTFSLSAFLYAILPNWQLFWLVDSLASRRIIPLTYIILAGAYSAACVSFLSFIALALFRQKEAGSNTK